LSTLADQFNLDIYKLIQSGALKAALPTSCKSRKESGFANTALSRMAKKRVQQGLWSFIALRQKLTSLHFSVKLKCMFSLLRIAREDIRAYIKKTSSSSVNTFRKGNNQRRADNAMKSKLLQPCKEAKDIEMKNHEQLMSSTIETVNTLASSKVLT
jgi:hypothetical protein